MQRVVSLCLPSWATDRLRKASNGLLPEKPLVTAEKVGSRRLVAAVDRAAQKLGLRPGLTIAHAQALVPDLTVMDAAPQADEEALAKLAAWCGRYSPLVAIDPPDGILIEVAGSAHLFEGEAGLMADAETRLARAGIRARAALADTPGAGWA